MVHNHTCGPMPEASRADETLTPAGAVQSVRPNGCPRLVLVCSDSLFSCPDAFYQVVDRRARSGTGNVAQGLTGPPRERRFRVHINNLVQLDPRLRGFVQFLIG